jgi:hypothetical protein
MYDDVVLLDAVCAPSFTQGLPHMPNQHRLSFSIFAAFGSFSRERGS